MILLIDNYDSFTYNLYQLIAVQNPDIKVVRNDKITIPEIEALAPTHIVISPGPGRPDDAGITEMLIKTFRGKIPIFGVCLGHQAIWEACGGVVGHAKFLVHGKESVIKVTAPGTLFRDMGTTFTAARYHSLAAISAIPDGLVITACSEDDEIMAIEDRENKLFGVQFHPESVMTPAGGTIIKNFLEVTL
jgi:anthranilate synthase component 2